MYTGSVSIEDAIIEICLHWTKDSMTWSLTSAPISLPVPSPYPFCLPAIPAADMDTQYRPMH